LEKLFLDGASAGCCFDLIAGTSTGGIIALGLGAGLTAAELRDLYIDRGGEIFPPPGSGLIGRLRGRWRAVRQYGRYIYDQEVLAGVLREKLGERKFGSSSRRLCVPSFDGEHGEVYIFKTPHHPDFKTDWRETMVKVALATSAAPTYYRPFRDAGYIFVDGGVWANNPITIALVEALASFEVTREQIRILSIGCGETAFTVEASQVARGGLVQWRNIISAAMRLQSQNALGQAGLLIGPERMIRVDLPRDFQAVELDDWATAVERLPGEAAKALEINGQSISEGFLSGPAAPYTPLVEMDGS
jgi:patatin-like phospholipase/acyl hydrolase